MNIKLLVAMSLVLNPVIVFAQTDTSETCLELAKSINLGMMRQEVERMAAYDGGLNGFGNNEVMYFPKKVFANGERCKVNVSFRLALGLSGQNQKIGSKLPNDVVIQVSKPFLQLFTGD